MLWLRYSALGWLFTFRDIETDRWEGFVRCTSRRWWFLVRRRSWGVRMAWGQAVRIKLSDEEHIELNLFSAPHEPK